MDKLTKEQFQKHLKLNCGDYNSMVSISTLYFALYGEYPKIGCSGEQRAYSVSMEDALPGGTEKTALEGKLRELINCENREQDSNTPDFILAEFMMGCLDAFELASNKREVFHGVHLGETETSKLPT